MESGNLVALEDCSGVKEKIITEESVLDIKKGNVNVETGEEVVNASGISEQVAKVEGLDSSGVAAQASVTCPASKISKLMKEPSTPTGGVSNKNKLLKEKPNMKGTTLFSRNQRPIPSQSLSFPARGDRADCMKSTDGLPMKTNVKQAQAIGTKAEFPFSNLHQPNRRASTGMNSKEGNTVGGGASARKTTIASMSRFQRSVSGKSGSLNVAANCTPSEVPLSADRNSKPVRTTLPVKEDDDAQSTTSCSTPGRRISTGSGFSFRLDERAEKRKEFFSKLEEKISAKEVEKTNLQAKSKENQVAEIRQLRKSMTFKATPMPTFYNEPPPKVELKKTPTTRAISPKLGRHKKPDAQINNNSEGVFLHGDQKSATKGFQAKNEKGNIASKNSLRKSQPGGLQVKQTVSTKTEGMPVKLKSKTIGAEPENQDQKQSQSQSADLPRIEDRIHFESEINSAQDDAPILIAPDTEIMPHEVIVGG